jgi:hypothetical protein
VSRRSRLAFVLIALALGTCLLMARVAKIVLTDSEADLLRLSEPHAISNGGGGIGEGVIVAIHRDSGGAGWPNIDTENIDANSSTRPAIVLTRPVADFTETARRNRVTGTVLLQAVLSRSGEVNQIIPEWKLPDGLTKQAELSAASIAFKPALLNGQPIDQRILIQYDFKMVKKD